MLHFHARFVGYACLPACTPHRTFTFHMSCNFIHVVSPANPFNPKRKRCMVECTRSYNCLVRWPIGLPFDHPHPSDSCQFAYKIMKSVTVVSWVSAHGHLSITRDFGPHGCLPGIRLYRNCYIFPLKWGTWALARDTTV